MLGRAYILGQRPSIFCYLEQQKSNETFYESKNIEFNIEIK